LNKCEGFCRVEKLLIPEVGSPKSQFHPVIIPPPLACDRSVNLADTSKQTDSKSKFAIGPGLISIAFVDKLEQPLEFVTVSVTV